MSVTHEQARALGDPVRHAIFKLILASSQPIGVADISDRLEVSSGSVRKHLSKLVGARLVLESRQQTGGRGRPRHKYSADPDGASGWMSERAYEKLSCLLVEVIRTGDSPREVGRRAAESEAGPNPITGFGPADATRLDESGGDESPCRLDDPGDVGGTDAAGTDALGAAAVGRVVGSMRGQGFSPEVTSLGPVVEVTMWSCPFKAAARADPETVCALHLGMFEGLTAGTNVVVEDLLPSSSGRAGCRLRLLVGGGPEK